MRLILKYKQGKNYCISWDNQEQTVDENTIKRLIANTLPSERNCKIVKGNVGMKAGYDELSTKGTPIAKTHRFAVYTNPQYAVGFKQSDIVININACFRTNLAQILCEFNALDKYYVKLIDNAEVFKVQDRLFIRSEDGVTTIDNISTGSKACILDNHLKHKVFNLTLCGENAIIALFNKVSEKGSANAFLLQHVELMPEKKYSIAINGKDEGNLCDLYFAILEEMTKDGL